jgi:hypothetical protein
MGIFDETRFVERLQFFNGQQLFASDLQGIEAFNREMRWLHNRSLHQPGIGNGFAVSGKKGDRQVAVQPGYALDACGREIVLIDTQIEPVPPVAAEPNGQPVFFDLAVSYPADDDLEEAETREGICLPRGVVRLRERPVFCWVRLRRDASRKLRPVDDTQALEMQQGLKIVLARAEVLNCQLNADLSIAQRRNARPPQQPYISCGTQPMEWEAWIADEPQGNGDSNGDGERLVFGLLARVDTSAADFHLTPCYSARVDGVRPLIVGVDRDEAITFIYLLDGPAYIQDAGPDGFTCYIPVVSPQSGILPASVMPDVIAAAREHWGVTWLGVED